MTRMMLFAIFLLDATKSYTRSVKYPQFKPNVLISYHSGSSCVTTLRQSISARLFLFHIITIIYCHSVFLHLCAPPEVTAETERLCFHCAS